MKAGKFFCTSRRFDPRLWRSVTDASVLFAFPYNPLPMDNDDAEMTQAKEYIDATVTQLFYTSNMAHDLFYR